jgi:hypothetical protein
LAAPRLKIVHNGGAKRSHRPIGHIIACVGGIFEFGMKERQDGG